MKINGILQKKIIFKLIFPGLMLLKSSIDYNTCFQKLKFIKLDSL